jgi:hypothetical protein
MTFKFLGPTLSHGYLCESIEVTLLSIPAGRYYFDVIREEIHRRIRAIDKELEIIPHPGAELEINEPDSTHNGTRITHTYQYSIRAKEGVPLTLDRITNPTLTR